MSAETTFQIPTRVGADGVPHATTRFTPTGNTDRPECIVRPWTVVPIVFVPGIMGSNLKAKKDIWLNQTRVFKQGARVWNVDSLTSPISWWGKGPGFRQTAFDHSAVMVDNNGKIGQGSYGETFGTEALAGESTGETPLSRIHAVEAKKRGWGTASWEYYGHFLDWLQYQLSDGRLVNGKPNSVFEAVAKLAGTSPPHDQKVPSALTEAQTRKMLDIHFPVYAAGYNWLQSNMDSGLDLMQGVGDGPDHVMGINEIIQRYDGIKGQTCKQVIVITHSMGGLVARAAALAHGGAGKMLGIAHGVQPIDGAAAFYKRLAAGFEGEGWGVPWITSHILGPTSKDTIPELAYNPGPLELAPNKRYNDGKPWLFIKDANGRVLKALPERGDPYAEIYEDTTHVWRAVNPVWLDPAHTTDNPAAKYVDTVGTASKYHAKLGGKLHPKTYAHWGSDPSKESWGSMTWSANTSGTVMVGNPAQWLFPAAVTTAGTERDVLSAQNKTLQMTVDDASDPGDGTVPAAASGAQIANYAGCLAGCALTGFDHQGDYNNETVRRVLLDALVRLVEPVEVAD